MNLDRIIAELRFALHRRNSYSHIDPRVDTGSREMFHRNRCDSDLVAATKAHPELSEIIRCIVCFIPGNSLLVRGTNETFGLSMYLGRTYVDFYQQ